MGALIFRRPKPMAGVSQAEVIQIRTIRNMLEVLKKDASGFAGIYSDIQLGVTPALQGFNSRAARVRRAGRCG